CQSKQRHLAALASLTYGRLLQLTIGNWRYRQTQKRLHAVPILSYRIGERIRLLASMGTGRQAAGWPHRQGAAFLAPSSTVRQVRCRCPHRLTIPSIRSSVVPAKPLDRARSVFVESLLEASVEDLVLSASLAATSNCCIADTTRLCQDLFAGRDPEVLLVGSRHRPPSRAWRNGDNAEAASMTPRCRRRFEGRQTAAASLTLAGARRPTELLFSGLTGTSSAASALAAAEQAADLARQPVCANSCRSSSVPDDGQPQQRLRWMTQAWCLIGLDWLLSARTAIAQQQPGNRACRRLLTAYQSDLRSARDVSLRIGADPRRWLAAHEAALRLLSGANPLAASFCLRQAESAFGAFANSATAERTPIENCAWLNSCSLRATAAAAESRLDWIVD
uniref:CHAT domain-containing protein n=1 Tax=Macrostomum lignano TaxID=282301 RepID=A0A1I8FDK9_9PLAT